MAACKVLNAKLEVVRTLSAGYLCLPLENGGWIEFKNDGFFLNSPSSDLLWVKKEYFHSRIKRFNKDFIIVLAIENQIIVNQILGNPIVFSEDLKLLKILPNSPAMAEASNKDADHFQIINSNTVLFMKNKNADEKKPAKTFKIFELNSWGKFKFPKDPKDYVEIDYSGGVEKVGVDFLIGFLIPETAEPRSIVGFISADGHWIKKVEIPFLVQEIKSIPYENFLQLNQL